MTLTPERLAEIRKRREAVTPGVVSDCWNGRGADHQLVPETAANAAFLAYVLTDIDDLLAEVEQLQAANDSRSLMARILDEQLLQELPKARLADELAAVLDEFDRYTSVPDDTGYASSPFRQTVQDVLARYDATKSK